MTAEALEVTIVAHDVGGIGGMERQLAELVTGLLDAGDRVTLVARTCAIPPRTGLRWVRVPGPARPFALAYPWFLVAGTLLTRLHRAGVVHTTGAIVLNRADVTTVHLCHHAVRERLDVARVRRATPAYRLNARIAALESRWGERKIYTPGRTAVVVAVSDGVARELRRFFPRMAARLAVTPNGVDARRFRPVASKELVRAALDLPRDGLQALFIGREWEGKGLRIAVEALPDAPAWRLVVVGEGDRVRYAALAEELGVGDRVHFVAPTPDLVPYYQAADAFLLPTGYETFSLVSYEAAACGLPLLVTRVSGVEDILQDGVNGYVIAREPSSVAACLRRLAASPSLRARMGAAARAAVDRVDWPAMVASYRAHYRSAATRGTETERRR
jgi:glycosyltransferase involved in cell wall biosynthesis